MDNKKSQTKSCKSISSTMHIEKKLQTIGINPDKLPLKKIAVPILLIIATLWFLIRVIPKPSRATYPCMKIAFPLASSVIIYISSIAVTVISSRLLRKQTLTGRHIPSALLAALCILCSTYWLGITTCKSTSKTSGLINESPNSPIGIAKGINPGRVVWIYDPESTNENCTNEDDDYWWQDHNTDQQVVDSMISRAIRGLTDASSDYEAWDALFKHYNKTDEGYNPGETIAIKVNLSSSDRGVHDDHSKKGRTAMMDTSPHVILAVLRQLVVIYGVNQEDIYIGDPHRFFYKRVFDTLHTEFPDIHYLDFKGGNGRTKTIKSPQAVMHYSDRKLSDHLPQQYLDAKYMINIPCFKAHNGSGISLAAKNHFGTQYNPDASHLHYSLPFKNPGKKKYRNLVDFMGHKDLGGKTILYLVDGLYGYYDWGPGAPEKWHSFDNDWSSSILASQDPVAIESVGLDIMRLEYIDGFPFISGTDDYLHQAADAKYWPLKVQYDPENDGTLLESLGVHEHWNNAVEKKYSRNLGTGEGIELYAPHLKE